MSDGRISNGAKRGESRGQGRKPKADEQKLIEKLTPMAPVAHAALQSALEDNEPWAVKLFFEYFYGKPRQRVDVTTNGESVNTQQALNITVHTPPNTDE
jgi:hypothetical protein